MLLNKCLIAYVFSVKLYPVMTLRRLLGQLIELVDRKLSSILGFLG